MNINGFQLKTMSWQKSSEHGSAINHKAALRFQSLDSLSPGTFRRICEERRDLFLDMRRNDMLLKLAKGELPFMIHPSDHETAADMAKKHYMDLEEIADHFRFMEYSGILTYYDSDTIAYTFFDYDGDVKQRIQYSPFAAFEGAMREMFSQMSTAEASDFVFDMLINKQVAYVERTSPGVSIHELD